MTQTPAYYATAVLLPRPHPRTVRVDDGGGDIPAWDIEGRYQAALRAIRRQRAVLSDEDMTRGLGVRTSQTLTVIRTW